MERRKKWTVIALLSAVISIGLFVGFSIQNIWRKDVSPMRFTFIWGPEEQDIVNGTLRIDVLAWFESYTWNNKTAELLNLLVKVNITEYSPDYVLTLFFNASDRQLFYWGKGIKLYSDNSSRSIEPILCPPRKVFTCTFNQSEGYTFGPYRLVVAEVMVKPENSTAYIPITINFGKADSGTVSFHLKIDIDETGTLQPPIYEIQITSVNISERIKHPDTPFEETVQVIIIEGKIHPPAAYKYVSSIVTNQEGKISAGTSDITGPDGSFKIIDDNYPLLPPGTYNVQVKLFNETSPIKSNIVQFTIEG